MIGANINLCNLLSGDVESKMKTSDFFTDALKAGASPVLHPCPYDVNIFF